MKRAWIAATLFFISGPAGAQAPQLQPPHVEFVEKAPPDLPDRVALAKELVELLEIRRGLQDNLGLMQSLVRMRHEQHIASKEKAQRLVASMDVGAAWATPYLMDEAVQLYARNLTAQELKDAIAFFRTPSGRSLKDKLPLLGNQFGTFIQGALPNILAATRDDYCRRGCDDADKAMFADLFVHPYDLTPPPKPDR